MGHCFQSETRKIKLNHEKKEHFIPFHIHQKERKKKKCANVLTVIVKPDCILMDFATRKSQIITCSCMIKIGFFFDFHYIETPVCIVRCVCVCYCLYCYLLEQNYITARYSTKIRGTVMCSFLCIVGIGIFR